MARRRADGVESRSLPRNLAGLRSFARHLEREGLRPRRGLLDRALPQGGAPPAEADPGAGRQSR